MIRIALCDDAEEFLQQTETIISQWTESSTSIITECFTNGDTLMEAHAAHPFDIVLLDVMMPLLNGIETARELRQHDENVKIVFLSSSPEFAVESYAVKASNYLLKPVEAETLRNCLQELIFEVQNAAHCIYVKSAHMAYKVRISDIEYLEAQGKHVVFNLHGGRTIRTVEPLYVYETSLFPEDSFFKCHRSYIVNMQYVDSFTQKEAFMQSGTRIPISRSLQKDFEVAYFSMIFGKAGDD